MCRSVVGQRTQLDICEKADISRWPLQILMAAEEDTSRNLCKFYNFIFQHSTNLYLPCKTKDVGFPSWLQLPPAWARVHCPLAYMYIYGHILILYVYFFLKRDDQNSIVVGRVFAFRDRGEYSHSHVRLPEVIERKVLQALAGTWTRVKQQSWMTRQTISQLS